MEDNMKTRVIRTVSVILLMSLICVMLASCGVKHKPDFVLEASEIDSIVTSYSAYFELDPNSVKEVKDIRYKILILNEDTEYSEIDYDTYEFKAKAITKDPNGWTYTESPYNEEVYGTDNLVKFLNKMRPPFTGDIFIQIFTFEDYTLFEVQNIEDSEIVDIDTAIFYKNRQIKKSDSTSLKSFTKVYKHQK